MSDTIKGKVRFLDGPNDYGFYSIKVDDTKYGIGKKRPKFEVGDTVEFEAYKKGKYWSVKGDVTVVDAEDDDGEAAPKKSTRPSSSASSGSRDGYWAAKEKYDREVIEPRITFLAAYERAVGFADLAIRNGCLPSLEKAKATDKLDVINAFVLEHTGALIGAANATALTAKPAAAKKPPKKDEDEGSEDDESEGQDNGEEEEEGEWS